MKKVLLFWAILAAFGCKKDETPIVTPPINNVPMPSGTVTSFDSLFPYLYGKRFNEVGGKWFNIKTETAMDAYCGNNLFFGGTQFNGKIVLICETVVIKSFRNDTLKVLSNTNHLTFYR